jgi:hemerythrin
MAFQWDENFATKIGKIDDQHRELLDRLNKFLGDVWKGRGIEEIEKTIDFLESHVSSHFTTEEEYMSRHGYSDLPAHHKRHEQFQKELSSLKAQLKREGATDDIVVATRLRLIDWFVRHIKREDREFTLFLEEKRKSQRTEGEPDC